MSSCFIIGNCHLNGLIRSTRLFSPTLTVDACALWDLASRFNDRAACLDHLGAFNTVFTMPFDNSSFSQIDSELLLSSLPNIVQYPTVTFNAFHPDVIYIFRKPFTGEFLKSPLGPYHSALAYYAYRKGYDASRTMALFHDDVFERIGYYTAWPASTEALLNEPRARQFGFERYVLSWIRKGCFMHNPQHPKLGPVSDIAWEMLNQAGFDPVRVNATAYLPDDLVNGPIWPVYPEISSYYGLSDGSYTFKRHPAAVRWPEFMSLEQFLGASFACFAEADLNEYYCDRVDGWLSDGTIL